MEYDIFISYRREGGREIARVIKAELEKMGFSVFLDFDELNDGHFEKYIIQAIDSSSVFMLILSPNALDLCIDEGDWVRKEIEYAIKKNCHIVPINPDQKFVGYPNALPETIQNELPNHQISDLMLGQLFKVSLSKLVEERILPHLHNTTLLHINTDSDCVVKKYGKEVLQLEAGVTGEIKLTHGKYLFDFVSKKNPNKHKEILYETNNNVEDYVSIELNPFSSKIKKSLKLSLAFCALLSVMLGLSYSGLFVKKDAKLEVVFAEDNTHFYINDVRFDLVYVQGGSYKMGNNNAEPDECPVHRVVVPNFYIGKYEISQEQWELIMGTNPSFKKGNKYPVENVNWFDAYMFIRKLNEITGRKFQLPTEAQWEYTASGGIYSKGYKYSGSNIIDEVAWYHGNSGAKTHMAVEQYKRANELEVYNMSGNVWEWCHDYYAEDYYRTYRDTINPQGAVTSNKRVIRGGSIQMEDRFSRITNRDAYEPSGSDWDIGFRIIMIP